jgi:hypothetical protein
MGNLIPPMLGKKFTVIAPDLPGIGDSSIPTGEMGMKMAAIEIHDLARSLGVTMHASWEYFVSWPQAAWDFAQMSRTKLTMPVLSVGGEPFAGGSTGGADETGRDQRDGRHSGELPPLDSRGPAEANHRRPSEFPVKL